MASTPDPADIRFNKLVEAIQSVLELSVEISFDRALYDTQAVEQLGRAARILASACERRPNL